MALQQKPIKHLENNVHIFHFISNVIFGFSSNIIQKSEKRIPLLVKIQLSLNVLINLFQRLR